MAFRRSRVRAPLAPPKGFAGGKPWTISGRSYDRLGFRQTLIEHWNGMAWTRQASPSPGVSSNDNLLQGVPAISATDVWALGDYEPNAAAPGRSLSTRADASRGDC